MNIQVLVPVVQVAGPNVAFNLTDRGKAQVSLTVVLSDGSHFSSTGSVTQPPATVLPPGTYDGAIVISAFNHGAFGSTYDSRIDIAGQHVATAKGVVPASGNDGAVAAFQLVVQ